MIRQKILIALTFWLGLNSGLFGAGWAILPVKSWNSEALENAIFEGPRLPASGEELSWDLARTMRAYLSAGRITNIIPMREVKIAYEKLRFTPQMALTSQDLKKLATLLDADNLLLTNIYGEKKTIRVESSVYYAHSQINADLISARGTSFWETFGQVSRQRFPSFVVFQGSGREQYRLVFGIDAQGKNYRDIPHLGKALKLLSPEYTAVTSVDGGLMRQNFSYSSSKNKAVDFISQIAARGSGKEEQLYIHLLRSIEEILSTDEGNPALSSSEQKVQVILMVGGRPASIDAQKRVRTYIRKIRHKADILILGTGGLSPGERDYWIDIAAEFNLKKSVLYQDIIYRQRVGLSTGHELFLFKNGSALLESNNGLLQDAHEVPLGRVRKAQLTPYNMVQLFEENSQARVITSKEVEIRAEHLIQEFIRPGQSEAPEENPVRVLVEIEQKPFWISIPQSAYYDSKNRPRLKKGENCYILLNLLPGELGQPFRNQPDFARIYSYNETPMSLVLPLNDYLKNPKSYLQKSIGNSSLYIIFARVVDIQLPRKFAY